MVQDRLGVHVAVKVRVALANVCCQLVVFYFLVFPGSCDCPPSFSEVNVIAVTAKCVLPLCRCPLSGLPKSPRQGNEPACSSLVLHSQDYARVSLHI
jgi:hypothetical protein